MIRRLRSTCDRGAISTIAALSLIPITAVTATGVRPTAICAANPALREWEHSGFSGTKTYTIGIEQDDDDDGYSGVCGRVPGNWGVLDFDGGANRNIDTQHWIDTGYEHGVSIGQSYSGDPGVPSPSLNLDQILGKDVILPVYDSVVGTGSGASYRISGFVGVDVISSKLSGAASQRSLTVRFTPVQVINGGCSGATHSYGAVTWKPCSLDGKGSCT